MIRVSLIRPIGIAYALHKALKIPAALVTDAACDTQYGFLMGVYDPIAEKCREYPGP